MYESKFDIGDKIKINNSSEIFLVSDIQIDFENKMIKYFISPNKPVGLWVDETHLSKVE